MITTSFVKANVKNGRRTGLFGAVIRLIFKSKFIFLNINKLELLQLLAFKIII